MACSAKQIIEVAAHEIGTTESPAGSNRNIYGAWYGMNGVAWCNIFVSWVFWQCQSLDLIGGKHAFTPGQAQTFDRMGRLFRGTDGIKAGDIAFFAFNGPNYQGRFLGIHHIGIVESVRADGYIVCIEGNTSRTSNDNGGTVMRQVRHPGGIAAYGRPDYVGTKSPLPKKFTLTRALMLTKPLMRDTDKLKDVSELQRALGFTGKSVDGIFGAQTNAAVRAFQRSKKLKVDGVVGKQTATKLGWVWKG